MIRHRIEVRLLIFCFLFLFLVHISMRLMFLFYPSAFFSPLCCILLISSALCAICFTPALTTEVCSLSIRSSEPTHPHHHQFPFSSSLGWRRWIGLAAQVLVYLSSLAAEPAGEVPYMRLAHIKRAPFQRLLFLVQMEQSSFWVISIGNSYLQ